MLRKFSVQVTIRVILIVVATVLLEFIYGDERLFFNQIILAVVLIAIVYNLIWYVHQTNRDVTRFLESIKQSDFTATFSKAQLGKSFNHLYNSFASIQESFENVKTENEAQYHFLQLLVEHINVGIISVAGDDNITLINSPAKKLLNLPGAKNWRSLKEQCPEFIKKIEEIGKSGKQLIETNAGNSTLLLSVDVSSTILIGQEHRLITFKDIHNEIEQNEMEAWHKLIRILTHEIMNSLTTVSSLTETMQMMLEPNEGEESETQTFTKEMLKDLRFSMKTIGRRSDGLLHFVENYRKVTKVPQPVRENVSSKKLIESAVRLFSAELKDGDIELTVDIEDFTLHIDQGQIDQVIINLISNSRHALKNRDNGVIQIKSYKSDSGYHISVRDNGIGIEEKAMQEIFVPFFTTRDDGSGIGLSLSKQIMSLHGGKINVSSEQNKSTTVLLTFYEN
jgi:two-component system nitrogen regulation sensor histidine kinase NtrY